MAGDSLPGAGDEGDLGPPRRGRGGRARGFPRCDVALLCRGEERRRRRWPGSPGTPPRRRYVSRALRAAARRSGRLRAWASSRERCRPDPKAPGSARHRELAALLRERWESAPRTPFPAGRCSGNLENVEEDLPHVEARLPRARIRSRYVAGSRRRPPPPHRRFPRVVGGHGPEDSRPRTPSAGATGTTRPGAHVEGRAGRGDAPRPGKLFLPGGLRRQSWASAASSPTAPAGESASAWKADSCRITEWSTRGSIPERGRSQSLRNSGARGYWIRSIRPGFPAPAEGTRFPGWPLSSPPPGTGTGRPRRRRPARGPSARPRGGRPLRLQHGVIHSAEKDQPVRAAHLFRVRGSTARRAPAPTAIVFLLLCLYLWYQLSYC